MKIKKGTIIINLHLSEHELFNKLHRRIKKSIRKAKRNNIIVEISKSCDEAYDLYVTSCKYLYLKPKDKKIVFFKGFKLFVAKINNKIISMYTVKFDENSSKEIYNATDPQYRDTQANSLLKWYIILYSKKIGLDYYDLGGFDPFNKDPKIKRINEYKLNWGGEKKLYYLDLGIGEYLFFYVRHFKIVQFFKNFYDKLKISKI